MKLATLALASVFVLSTTVALAYTTHHKHRTHQGTTYQGTVGYYGDPYGAYAAAPNGAYGAGLYGGYGYGYSGCAPGPRVGAFATQPWTNTPTCPY
jgi:hypothetical protein